ncbi:hypothetical protein BD414DRAFT_496772 [Trametes punicea]|nr:hypothetical protein BD414DRAFT_496772 [Trametes punicea]
MNILSNSTNGDFMFAADPSGERRANLGAVFIGTLLGLLFYGVSIHQACVFFTTESKERDIVSKAAVSVILLLETVHSALCMHANYHALIVNGESSAGALLNGHGWSINILSVFSAVIFCLTQSVFARSLCRLWPTYGVMLAIGLGVLAAGQLGTVIASSVLLYMPRTEQIVRQIRWLSCAHSAMVMTASELLAGALITYLWRRRTGFTRTNHIIGSLILYTFNTGLIVGITSLLSLIFVARWPSSLFGAAVEIVATSLYAVPLLSQLNSQQELSAIERPLIVSEATRHLVQVHTRSSPTVNMFNSSRRVSQGQHSVSVRTSNVYWQPRRINILITAETEVVVDEDCKGPIL